MTLLLLGLALWIAAHLVKRLAPGARSALDARLGPGPARGLFAAAIGLGLVLIILGYRQSPSTPIHPLWTVHLNNLLMLVAVLLFAASHSKSRIKNILRNPMLTAVVVWAVAHLLVNGDLASVILFGGMGLWALASILIIDASSAPVTAVAASTAADLRLIGIGVAAFVGITSIHAWLGVWPFPG